jgi:hypothetical protein
MARPGALSLASESRGWGGGRRGRLSGNISVEVLCRPRNTEEGGGRGKIIIKVTGREGSR